MADMMLAMFSILAVLVVSIRGDDKHCYEDKAGDQCIFDLNYLEDASLSPLDIVAGNRTREFICNEFKETKRCTSPYDDCPSMVTRFNGVKWDITKSIMTYVCDKAPAAFDASNDCWTHPNVKRDVDICKKDEWDNRAKVLDTSTANKEEKCTFYNRAVACYIKAAKDNCYSAADSAAKVMAAFQVWKYIPRADPLGCTLAADDGTFTRTQSGSGGNKITYPCLTLVAASLFWMSSWIN